MKIKDRYTGTSSKSHGIMFVSIELGGNAPFIVFNDADIEQAVHAAMASKFRNAGQTCVCADRFIIHEDIEEEFVKQLRDKVSKLKVGRGLEGDTTMGPLILDSVPGILEQKVKEAIDEGAECVIGGVPMPQLGSNYFEPTILRNVNPMSEIWSTETFGPVAAIKTFQHEEEAIELANDTLSGLAAYFCSKDMDRVFRVAERCVPKNDLFDHLPHYCLYTSNCMYVHQA